MFKSCKAAYLAQYEDVSNVEYWFSKAKICSSHIQILVVRDTKAKIIEIFDSSPQLETSFWKPKVNDSKKKQSFHNITIFWGKALCVLLYTSFQRNWPRFASSQSRLESKSRLSDANNVLVRGDEAERHQTNKVVGNSRSVASCLQICWFSRYGSSM